MGNKLNLFERRMININGDLQERVIYQRHMAEDIFQGASGIIDEALETVASGILGEPFVLADTAHNVPNPHYIYSLDTNVVPDASGTRSVGTPTVWWGDGYFDTLYGDGSNLTGLTQAFVELIDTPAAYPGFAASGVRVNGTLTGLEFCDISEAGGGVGVTDHNALNNLEWSAANHTIDDDIVPIASGTTDLGSISLAFDNAYIDKAYLEADPTTPLMAATKQYVDTMAATAAGADKQIQFNDNGVFAGDSDLTWDKTTETLSVDGNVVFNNGSNDRDFRVKTDGNASMLFVDGGQDMVIIGNNTPMDNSSLLEIVAEDVNVPFRMGAFTTSKLECGRTYYHKSHHGDLGTLAETLDGEYLGAVVCYGVDQDPSWAGGAWWRVIQRGAAGANYVGADWVFTTFSSTGENTDQFILVNDGTIAPGGSVIPNASGTLDLGSISYAFDEAYIDKVHLEADPTTPLMAATKQYVDDAVSGDNYWDRAGTELSTHNATDDIVPNASGTQKLGTVSLAFNEAHIDKVYLECDPIDGFQATTKDYVDILVQGLDWQPSVDGMRGAPVPGPSNGDRYIATATASGWTDNNIYEWQTDTWEETVANEGFAAWVEDENLNYVFNGVDWVKFGSTITHNNLSGLQGGNGSDEFYHLTNITYGYIDQNVTSGAAPTFTADNLSDGGTNAIVTTTQETNWDNHIADNSQAHSDYLINTGDTIAGNLDPEASGTRSLGTVSLAFDNAHIDKLYLEGDPTTGFEATTKDYVDNAIADIPADSDTLQTVTDRGATTTNIIYPGAGVIDSRTTNNVEHDILTTRNTTDTGIKYQYDTGGAFEMESLRLYVAGSLFTEMRDNRSGTEYIFFHKGIVLYASTIQSAGNFTIGEPTTDCGYIKMIRGAQTGDPEVTMALSADANGNFSITTDTGDISMVPFGGDLSVTGNIVPEASGTRDIGSLALAFDNAYLDKVYLEANPTTPLQAATKQYVDTQVGSIVESDTLEIVTGRGATTSNIITPNASGTVDLGTVALAFNDAYFDRVNLEANPTTQFQAANKGYVDEQVSGVVESDTLDDVCERGATTDVASTFSAGITANITGDCTGNAGTVTNGVYTTDFPLNQDTTGKADTAGNADTVTNGVYTTDFPLNQDTTGNAATVTTNANLTGEVTSVGNAATISDSVTVTGWTMGTFSGTTYTGAVTGNCSGSSGSCTGNSATVTGYVANGETLTLNTGALTLTPNADDSSVLTIGAGAVSVSGSNTGDQDLSGYALIGQTMYIGTTGVAINRTSAALTLAGITLTTPDIGTPSAGTLTNCTFPTLNQNTTGSSASCTGNAATATALATARNIGGVSFDGTANIVPTTIAVTDTADASCYVGLWESASGDLLPQTDTGLTYNASTGMLTATGLTGPLTGNADTVTNGVYTTDFPLNQDTTGNASTATLATTFTCTDNESEDLACNIVFVDGATGAQGAETDGDFTYNPSTGTVTATTFAGAVIGSATQITVADESADISCYPVFVTAATGNLAPKTGTNLTFNSSTGLLTATGFSGPLTGNADTVTNGVYTTDFPLNQDTTGKADTAGNADTVTTNANLTGIVTSVGNATAIANKAIAIAKLADGTDGELITWGTDGVVTTVSAGTSAQVLTSNGPDTVPTFQDSSAEADTLASVVGRGATTVTSISTGGLTVTGGSIAPNASGSIDIGTLALAFDDAYIDKLYLEGNPTTGLQATTKDYVDTVVGGAGLWLDGGGVIYPLASGNNVTVGGDTDAGVYGSGVLVIEAVAPPTTSPSNVTQLYSEVVSNSGDDTVLLLHCDGTDGSTTITDSSPELHGDATVVLDAELDTAVKKWGTASLILDGTGDYVYYADSADWDRTTNWTIDLWVKCTNYNGIEVLVSQGSWSNGWHLYMNDGHLYFKVEITGSQQLTLDGGVVSDTDWHHVAMCKVGSLYGIYLDGIQTAYVSSSQSSTYSEPLVIGALSDPQGFFDGHLDEIRICQSNPFGAGPNVGKTDTITVPAVAYDVRSAELKVRDEYGNITTLSPHNFKNIPQHKKVKSLKESEDMAWTYHSEKDGKSITVDMWNAIKDLEKLTGKQYIYIKDSEGNDISGFE